MGARPDVGARFQHPARRAVCGPVPSRAVAASVGASTSRKKALAVSGEKNAVDWGQARMRRPHNAYAAPRRIRVIAVCSGRMPAVCCLAQGLVARGPACRSLEPDIHERPS